MVLSMIISLAAVTTPILHGLFERVNPAKRKNNPAPGEVKAAIVGPERNFYISPQTKDGIPMIIRTRAYARAGLVGNPSDGYFGKTISIIVKNYCAEVTLYETPHLEILPAQQDSLRHESMKQLASEVELYGYYGGVRLLKAAIKRFYDYCRENSIDLPERNFSVEYRTDVPQRVGLAGSSAIITATLRAMMRFFQVSIELPQLANLTLSVETRELGLPAGLQDRVIQAYEGWRLHGLLARADGEPRLRQLRGRRP